MVPNEDVWKTTDPEPAEAEPETAEAVNSQPETTVTLNSQPETAAEPGQPAEIAAEEPTAEAQPESAEARPETAAEAPREAPAEDGESVQNEQSAPEIYADAHYEPAAETTVPPRYYTPPQKTVRVRAVPKKEKRKLNLGAVVALCLVCALLGGLLGAGISSGRMEKRLAAVEQALEENAQNDADTASAVSALEQRPGAVLNPVLNTAGTLSRSQIYDLACSQVVGISTTVTTTGFFGQAQTGEVSGSGFILSEDGYIITNYHVIEYAQAGDLPVTVVLHDGTEYEARIVGMEDMNDIAVLKIDATGLNPVAIGDSDTLQVGDEIYAVGNPLGELEFSMSTGHVSALDRTVSTQDAEAISMFQIDAAVNSGNSGGPVYNDRGQVIGVVTAKYSDTGVEGLGFAIPVNDAVRIAQDLITNGYVTGKAYMGVWLDDRYNSMVAQYYNMPLGAYVNRVEPDSAAAKAGLEDGDIITRVDEADIASAADLRTAIRQYGAGDSAVLTVYRAGESMTLTIVFDEKTPQSGTTQGEG